MKLSNSGRLRPALVAAVIILLSLFLTGGKHTLAQQSVTSATVSGRVSDANDAAVSGASVAATSLETNQRQTATTDGEGRYRFPYLPVGTFSSRSRRKALPHLISRSR
jgi:protocatechuate 3,4-dioxygenase beta subunit